MKTRESPEHNLPSVEEAARADVKLLFSRLTSSPEGLTRREVAARIARCFCGIGPNRETLIGMVEGKPAAREKWLAKMRELGAKGA